MDVHEMTALVTSWLHEYARRKGVDHPPWKVSCKELECAITRIRSLEEAEEIAGVLVEHEHPQLLITEPSDANPWWAVIAVVTILPREMRERS